MAISRGGNELLIRKRTNTLRFGAVNQTRVAIQEPKRTTFARTDGDVCGRHTSTFPLLCKASTKGVFVTFLLLYLPPPPAVISAYVLGGAEATTEELILPPTARHVRTSKTSRCPGCIDPDLNPALLSRILRRAELFITQHAPGADEGESATQGYTREECKE